MCICRAPNVVTTTASVMKFMVPPGTMNFITNAVCVKMYLRPHNELLGFPHIVT